MFQSRFCVWRSHTLNMSSELLRSDILLNQRRIPATELFREKCCNRERPGFLNSLYAYARARVPVKVCMCVRDYGY